MKRVNIIVGVLAVVVIVLLSFLAYRPEEKPVYNAATESRVTGTVQEVQEFYCPVSDDRGTHLVVKTESGSPMLVHVGVGRALRAKNVGFIAGDKVEVVGSKVRFRGADSIIAREISRDRETFILRDSKGTPILTQ